MTNSRKPVSLRSGIFGLATILVATLPGVAAADTILGIYAGASRWDYELDGSFSSDGTTINTDTDLQLDDDDSNVLYVALEHPIPLLPNVKIQRNDLDFSGNATLGRDITYAGTTFLTGVNIDSTLDLSNTDYILYYEILDNWVNLDLGLNFKKFDGDASISSLGQTASEDLDETLPMLYGKAQFDLPFTGLSAGGTLNYTAYDGNDVTDASVYLAYAFDLGLAGDLGAEVGYRTMQIDIDEFDDFEGDIDVDGFYIGVFYHF